MNFIPELKKVCESLRIDSVHELFREATRPSAPLYELTENFSLGCHQTISFDANDEPIEIVYDWYVVDNDAQRHAVATAVFKPFKEDLNDCINRVLKRVYTDYEIDVWKSIQSHNTYCFLDF